jgi:hypothetical protein
MRELTILNFLFISSLQKLIKEHGKRNDQGLFSSNMTLHSHHKISLYILGCAYETQYLVSQISNANGPLNRTVDLRERKYFRKFIIFYLKSSLQDNLDIRISLVNFFCYLYSRQLGIWMSDSTRR